MLNLVEVGVSENALKPRYSLRCKFSDKSLEQREFLDNAGDVAAAVAAIDCRLEYLEQSTQRRTQFAAAVNRLDAAIGRQIGGGEPSQFTKSERVQPQWAAAPAVNEESDSLLPPHSLAPMPPLLPRERYQQLWERYSEGVWASNPVRLDYLVGRRAFEAGCSQKEIARMLIAGSGYVRQIGQVQGQEKARDYVNQMARVVCRKAQEKTLGRGRSQELDL